MCKIFIAYLREDEVVVLDMYDFLKESGFRPWLDQRNLSAGMVWERETQKAIESADIFLACFSAAGASRRSVFHKEIRLALEVAQEMPEGRVYFIPIRLDECNLPLSVRHIQYLDYYNGEGKQSLRSALQQYCGQGLSPTNFPDAMFVKGLPKHSRERSEYYKERAREQVREWGRNASQGRWDWNSLGNALEDLLDAIRYDPENQHAWTNLGYLYYLLDKRELARKCLDRSFALARPGPNHPGRNYKNVKRAIDTDLSLSGMPISRQTRPDWFEEKYTDFLKFGPGSQVEHTALRGLLSEHG